MISVIIPTHNSEDHLGPTLSALVPAAVDGLVREVIVADGGSTDQTLMIVDGAGADLVTCAEANRGLQFAAGAKRATFPWLLFLHPETELEAGWEREASQLIERISSDRRPDAAAVFRLMLDDEGFAPRASEALGALRSSLLKLPHGDQGLLISRRLYESVGGYRPLPLLHDVDLARRLGRGRITALRSRAILNGVRVRQEGYLRRFLRHQACLALYFLKVPPKRIAALYGDGGPVHGLSADAPRGGA